MKSKIKISQSKIIQNVEKESKIVPINFYRKAWFVIGMAAFGMPIGVAFGSSLGNMGFIGIGLPIGIT